MQHRQRGKHGPKVSAIGLGGMVNRTPGQDFHPLSVGQESEHDLVECSRILRGCDVSAIRCPTESIGQPGHHPPLAGTLMKSMKARRGAGLWRRLA